VHGADADRRDQRESARANRRRQLRRQRAAGAAAVLVVAATVAVIVLQGKGAPAPSTRERAGAPATRRRAAAPSRPRRAAFSVSGAAARTMRIPILMYHVVSAPRPETPNPELWVAPEDFRAQMQALRRHGYTGISLREAHAAWTGRGALPPRPVVVSFDDGYLSDYTHAGPVLKALGWPGVLNLELRNVGPGGITAHQVRSLVRDGWEVDSHTIDHPDLTTLGPRELRRQVVVSRRELRRRFKVPVDFFCYPSGRVNPTVASAVRAAGYQAATTTVEGFADARQGFRLARVRVNGSDTAASLLKRLRTERGARAGA
jgi:peptidoglycan/xylan/chitin deacetylase (PgdA/CDA1 family)